MSLTAEQQQAVDDLKKSAIDDAKKSPTGQKVGAVLSTAGSAAGVGAAVGGPVGAIVGGVGGLVVGSVIAFWDDVFGDPDPNANNAKMRKELDAYSVPPDFDVNLYYSLYPAVGLWANGLGLNDSAYVQKAISYHWFLYGNSEGKPYPYKIGTVRNVQLENYFAYMAQKPVNKGTYDWVGMQTINGKQMVGFHTNIERPNLKQGDTVTVAYKNFTARGKIVQMGTDDGQHIDSLFVLDMPMSSVPRTVNYEVGSWEKVTPPSTVVGYAAAGIAALGLIYFAFKKWIL